MREEEKELNRKRKATKKTREEIAEAELEGKKLKRQLEEGRRRKRQLDQEIEEERQRGRRLQEERALLQVERATRRTRLDEEARSLKNRRRPSSPHGRRPRQVSGPIEPENARFEPEPYLPSYEESEEATSRGSRKQRRGREQERANKSRQDKAAAGSQRYESLFRGDPCDASRPT